MMNAEQYTLSKLRFEHAESNSALADSASIEVLIRTPTASDLFFGSTLYVTASFSAGCDLALFESPTVSDPGEPRTPQCLTRLPPPPACPVAVSVGPTVTDDGTSLQIGHSHDQWSSGDWILKPATDYLLRLTNVSGSPAHVALSVGLGIIPNKDYLYLERCNTGATPRARR